MRLKTFTFISFILFTFGAYIWIISNRGVNYDSDLGVAEDEFYIKVNGKNISKEDVNAVYKEHVSVVSDKDNLTAIPSVNNLDMKLEKLKLDITGNFLEREVLLKFIKMDKLYKSDKKAFYSSCKLEVKNKFSDLESSVLKGEMYDETISNYCDRAYIIDYFENRIASKIKISDLELEAYYHNNKSEFMLPSMVKIRQIVLADENTAKKVRYRTTRSNFTKMVEKYSISPEKEDGGTIGPYKKGDMPRFFDVAFQMRRNQISGILKSIYGFHIIHVLKKYRKRTLTFVEAKPIIRGKILAQKKQEVYKEWVEEALKAVNVTISKY